MIDRINSASFQDCWIYRKSNYRKKPPSNNTLWLEKTSIRPVFNYALSIAIIISACLHSSLSWGSFNGIGIWCEPYNIKTNDVGFYFFDSLKVGFFKNEHRESQKYNLTFIDLSPYKANTKKLNWQTLEYDNQSKSYIKNDYDLDIKTLILSMRKSSTEAKTKFQCETYSAWGEFLNRPNI